MNDFLEQIWLDNPVKNYFIVAGIILFVIILKKIISRYLAGLLFKVVNKIWKDVDREPFVNLLVQPLGFFLLIMVSIASLHKLNFPTVLNVDIYRYTAKHIVHSIGTIVLIVSFIWLLLRIIDFIAIILGKKADLTPDQSDNQLVVFFRDFFKVILSIVGIVMVLNYVFDVNVGSIITGLSIVGAAIALALRESLENLIASFIIFFDKPFTTGDLVKVQSITGTVEKIGLRSTRIRSESKTLVSVPNKQMVDSIVDNLSLRTQRRADLRLELDLKTSKAALTPLIATIKKILTRTEIEENTVLLSEISNNGLILLAEYYTAPLTMREFNMIREETNLKVLQAMEDAGIELAGTGKEIRIVNGGAR
jgi:MscS family membrane protein